jgi:hypothetical protein
MMRWPAALVCVLGVSACWLDRDGSLPDGDGGGGGGGRGGSGGAPIERECLDGTDDDGDGKADCDDPDCEGIATCLAYQANGDYVLLVPEGQGCAADDTPVPLRTCTKPKVFLGGGGCECVKDPGSCIVDVDTFDHECTLPLDHQEGSFCYTPTASGDYGISVHAHHAGDASCGAGAPTANTADMLLCRPPAVQSCKDHPTCVRTPQTGETWCVLWEGQVPCTTPFEDVTFVYDGRGGTCSCSCSGPTSTACPAPEVQIHHGTVDCMSSATTLLAADGLCHPAENVFSFKVGPVEAVEPMCTVNDALENPPEPKTLCCLPPPR